MKGLLSDHLYCWIFFWWVSSICFSLKLVFSFSLHYVSSHFTLCFKVIAGSVWAFRNFPFLLCVTRVLMRKNVCSNWQFLDFNLRPEHPNTQKTRRLQMGGWGLWGDLKSEERIGDSSLMHFQRFRTPMPLRWWWRRWRWWRWEQLMATNNDMCDGRRRWGLGLDLEGGDRARREGSSTRGLSCLTRPEWVYSYIHSCIAYALCQLSNQQEVCCALWIIIVPSLSPRIIAVSLSLSLSSASLHQKITSSESQKVRPHIYFVRLGVWYPGRMFFLKI